MEQVLAPRLNALQKLNGSDIMGLLNEFINGTTGGINAVLGNYRRKKFNDKDNHLFLKALKPGTVILQGPVQANFVSGGIQGATDSFWTHAIVYAGDKGAELIRQTRQDLPPIVPHEFVEATYPLCRIGNLEKDYCYNLVQQIAFIFNDIPENKLIKILDYAYSRVGTKYDVSEIVRDMLPAFQIKHHAKLHGCSSLVASSFCMGGLSVTPHTVAPATAFPSHIYKTLYPRMDLDIAKWNY